MKCKIVKSDGTLPLKTAKVAVINNALHSIWATVRVLLNDHCIATTQDYGYRSYVTTCLTYSSSVKSGLLSTQGYYQV